MTPNGAGVGRLAGNLAASASLEQPALIGQVGMLDKSASELFVLVEQLEAAADRLRAEPTGTSAGDAPPPHPNAPSLENRIAALQHRLNLVCTRLAGVANRFDRAV